MNGERRDQSNLVFRYAMPLEFILDRIIRFDPSFLLIIATVLKISYRYLCHQWKIANRSRTTSILSYILIVNVNTQTIELENCSNMKKRRKDERNSPVTSCREIRPCIAKNYVAFICSYTYVKRFIELRFDTFLKFFSRERFG